MSMEMNAKGVITTVHRVVGEAEYILYNPIEIFEFPRRDDELIQPPTAEEVKADGRHLSASLEETE